VARRLAASFGPPRTVDAIQQHWRKHARHRIEGS
jgi:hypothetical protein